MEKVIMERCGVSKNFQANHERLFFDVFYHMGQGGVLGLSMQKEVCRAWNSVPVGDYLGGYCKDRYMVTFHGNKKSTAHMELVKFVKRNFNVELVFPKIIRSIKRHEPSERLTKFMDKCRMTYKEIPAWCHIQFYATYNTYRKYFDKVDYYEKSF